MKSILFISILTAFIVVPSISAVDFNGDGTGDVAVFRGSTGLWAVRGLSRFYFGAPGDYPVPLNYNSSSVSAAAIFRPSSGLWAVRGVTRIYYGALQDNPITGDFNGDGLNEIGIFRSSSGLWAVRDFTRMYFGSAGDIPVSGDYNGDATAEAGIFRSSSGLWAIRSVTRSYFGGSSDLPVPADYNGDGLQDIGIFRSNSGLWALRNITREYFGAAGDLPQSFDLIGDGSDKISIFRQNSGLWATRGISRIYFGGSIDSPVSSPRYWSMPEISPFGIELTRLNWDEIHMEKLRESGAGTTRMGYLSWAALEPGNTSPDNYLWEKYDSWMALYGEKGLTVIVTIADIPSWAGETRSGPFNDDARDDFAEFVGAVVNRYSRPPYNIKYWEFFNEPDGTQPTTPSTASWGYFGKEYALMLKAVYPAVKAADPSSQVLLGGLAYDNFVGEMENGFYNRYFIDDVLKYGGGDYFDVMNFHYYYFAREEWGNIIGKATWLKNILIYWGVTKPIICTEAGVFGYEEDYYLSFQARYVPKVYVRGLSVGLETILWFPLASPVGSSFEGGLVREEDLSAKPAYLSYQTMTTELGDYRYSAIVATGSNYLEGYEFISSSSGKSKQVIWAEEDTSGYNMSFPYERIRVVSIDGSEQIISDGGAGDLDGSDNGQVRIVITPSPVYVESW